jgi:exonuclease SbcC
MIPARLELTNFLCYRDPAPLDLSGIHIACLIGENGAGKSSLLDAMTWALWGQARTRRDDDLIHQDQEEMQVQFDFSLGQNSYRVVRKRSRRGRGQSMLDLQIQDGDIHRSLAETTIRATQEKINRLLRLDYRTFINSAFLLQGRADEFTIQTPSERKAILADILGLDIWDLYEERAKERIRATDQEQTAIAAQITEIDLELGREAGYKDALLSAEEEARQTTDQLRAAEQVVRRIDAARQAMRLKQGQLGDLQRRLDQGERQLEQLRSGIARQQTLMAEYHAVLAAGDEIRAGYQRWIDARGAETAFSLILSQHARLAERQAKLKGDIQAVRADLLARQRALNERCAELAEATAEDRLVTEIQGVRAELAVLQDMEKEREEVRDRANSLDQEAAELRARNESLRLEMDAIKEKIDMLSVETGANCPLCRQPLTEDHRQELLEQFQAEGTERGDTWRNNRARAEEIQRTVDQLREQLQQFDRKLEALAETQRREATLMQRAEAASEAARMLERQRAELAAVAHQLERTEYAVEAHAELRQIQGEIAELGYDPSAHEEARAGVHQYAAFEERHAQLETAASQTDQAATALSDLEAQEKEWEASLMADRNTQTAIAAEVADLKTELIDAVAKERELARLREAKVIADNRVGAAQQRLSALEILRERRTNLVAQQTELAQERTIYQELRAAFGKKGVPAMIIEAIIPEIEEVANRLLAQMTDGRMHVRFETQREKVTGGIAETLDIRISDELGTRNYELYSGGESFRVNFAIRIALSKLLASRTGAQLRTLFVDEGFGTQDARGRERLVEAINAIQDDFERILVITHIDELKDSFPVRIEVTKGSQGSQIQVI